MQSTSSTSPPASTPPAKRACDACHLRKVKCIGDGAPSCKNCTSAGLTCTYNSVPQRKGPKGSRAKVISMLRESQRQPSDMAGLPRDPSFERGASDSYTRKAGLLSMDVMLTCVDYFFAHLYPTQPILHRHKLGQTIALMDADVDAYCGVLALCAYMLIQPNMALSPAALDCLSDLPAPATPQHLGALLLHESLRMRKSFDYSDAPTAWTVSTSFFLFGSLFCLGRHNAAWFHLREAVTLAHLAGMHEEAGYELIGDAVERACRRRLYWLLFVTERAYSLQQHKPLTLHATIDLPTLDDDPSETTEISGFLHLVALFRPFDDTFLGLWNKTRNSRAGVGAGDTTGWLATLQSQLTDALPIYLRATETQAVDLRCSREWLRTMVWQMGVADGALSSDPADGAMSLRFPIDVARNLVTATSQFQTQAMEVHGIGFIEKLFDVACTLTDVMACVPNASGSPSAASVDATSGASFELGPRDYLAQLTKLIGSLRGGRQRFMAPLLEKLHDAGIRPPADASPAYGLQPPIPSTSLDHARRPPRDEQLQRLQLQQLRQHLSDDVLATMHPNAPPTRPMALATIQTHPGRSGVAATATAHLDGARFAPFPPQSNLEFGIDPSHRPVAARAPNSAPDGAAPYGGAHALAPLSAPLPGQELHGMVFPTNVGRRRDFGGGGGDAG